MIKLYNKLKEYTIDDTISLENNDPQYKALENLYSKINDKKQFFSLILVNSLLAYQLSSTGEKYWEEFSICADKYFCNKQYDTNNICKFFKDFLPKSKGNKRLLNMKLIRITKIELFLEQFIPNLDNYLDNLAILRDELANAMKQKKDAKTIVFAIKMILYGKRISNLDTQINIINQITIPIDSRLEKIFDIYKEDYTDIKKFYRDLSIKLNIPEIHLDAILWLKYKELTK
ncbi:N-glycosylase/DNA lyase [Candidatus Gracilibacteria bacterium]|nr:N-glycosylase/DNA lyase [Candidatus Gracilibacteria bacterium]